MVLTVDSAGTGRDGVANVCSSGDAVCALAGANGDVCVLVEEAAAATALGVRAGEEKARPWASSSVERSLCERSSVRAVYKKTKKLITR